MLVSTLLLIVTILTSFDTELIPPVLKGMIGVLVLLLQLIGLWNIKRVPSSHLQPKREINPTPPVEIGNLQSSPEKALNSEAIQLEGSIPNIQDDVAEVYTLIPFVKAILIAVPRKTEQAILHLIDECVRIKSKAHQESQLSQESLNALTDSESKTALPQVIRRTRETINHERENIARLVIEHQANTNRLHRMRQEIDDDTELLTGIKAITLRASAIAIKLAVEADHIGEKGRRFQMIAGELHSLNKYGAEYSTKVGTALNRFKEYKAALISSSLEQSTVFAEAVDKGFLSSLQSFEGIITASCSCGDMATKVALHSREIDSDLQSMLESLQFQDITRQMVEGAIAILDDLNRHLGTIRPMIEKMNGKQLTDNEILREKVRQNLINRSKTLDEKQAITEVV